LSDEELAIAVPLQNLLHRRSLSQSRWMFRFPRSRGTCAANTHASSGGCANRPGRESAPPPAEEIAVPAQAEVQEVDLSDEWATLIEETQPSELPVQAPAPVAAKPARQTKPADVEEFSIGEDPRFVPADGAPAITSFELADASPAVPLKAEPVPEKAAQNPRHPSLKKCRRPKLPRHRGAEPEFELEQEYELVLEQESLVPAYDQRPPETPVAPPAPKPVAQNAAPSPPSGSGFASDQFLADLANEIDQLGIGELRLDSPDQCPTLNHQLQRSHRRRRRPLRRLASPVR